MLQSERIQLLKPELSHVDLMQQWENASANMIESQLLMPYNKFTLIDFVKHNNDLFHEKDGGGNFIKGIPANATSEMSASDIMFLIRKGKHDKPGMPVFESMSRKDALLISSYVKEQLR